MGISMSTRVSMSESLIKHAAQKWDKTKPKVAMLAVFWSCNVTYVWTENLITLLLHSGPNFNVLWFVMHKIVKEPSK